MIHLRRAAAALALACVPTLLACQHTPTETSPPPQTADTPATTPDPKPDMGDAVASVNGVPITRARFQRELERVYMTAAMTGNSMDMVPEGVIETKLIEALADDMIVRQHLDAAGLNVGDTDVQAWIDAFMASTDDFDTYLKQTGTSPESFKDNVRTHLLLKADLAAQGRLKVPDAESAAFYDANKQRLFTRPERVRAAHILVLLEPSADTATQKAARARIDAIHREASKPGADFAALAQARSEGPSGPDGGNLGWFGKKQMVPEFEKAAFAMKADEISKPIQTQFGWHILKVYEREDAHTTSLEEARPGIVEQLEDDKAHAYRQELADKLRPTADIEIFGAP